MSNPVIRSYFEQKIATWAAGQSPALPVAYEDVPFTPPASGPYVEVFLLPAATLTATVKADRFREIGLCQVSIYVKAGNGPKVIDALAESLIAAFPVTPKGTVSVESRPYSTKLNQELNGFCCEVVTINYRFEI